MHNVWRHRLNFAIHNHPTVAFSRTLLLPPAENRFSKYWRSLLIPTHLTTSSLPKTVNGRQQISQSVLDPTNRSYSETVIHLITYLTLSIKRLKIINDSITVELICGSSPRSPIQTPVLTIPIDTLSANATAIAVRHWPQFLRLLSTNVLPREYHCLLKHLIFCGHVPTSWRCLTDCLNLPSNSQK